jgi:putative hydrolase of the HAD superfamily
MNTLQHGVNQLQAIIFDLDDTLYSEEDFVLSGFRAVADWAAEKLGIESQEGYISLSSLYHQGIRNNTFDFWLSLHQVETSDITIKLIDVYRNHSPNINPFPEINTLLQNLSRFYKIGLVSDGYLAVQKRKLAALKLEHFFDAIVFSDELGRENWKPSIEPFKKVLEKLHTTPKHSIYIGDNPKKDFFGARQLGMYTIQIKHQKSEYGELEPPTSNHAPNEILFSLKELASKLLP